LESWVKDARRHGVERHQVVTWVRRKLGGDVVVWRHTADGVLAVATPCTLCCRELQRFDLRVHCSLGPDSWYSGRLNEAQAPPVGLTSGQRRRFDRPQPLTPQRQQGAVHSTLTASPRSLTTEQQAAVAPQVSNSKRSQRRSSPGRSTGR